MNSTFTGKRLFLLDASMLIYRAYFAFIRTPRFDSKGNNTSALLGFANSLIEIIKKEKPDYLAVVFDPAGGSFRHREYADYKAQRDATPEGILWAFPQVKRLLEALRIPAIEVPDYEADDVVGTLSQRAEKEGFEVYMVTADKDYGQLVTGHSLMYRPGTKGAEVWGEAEVCEKFGLVHCSQMVDYLALVGDTSDNIPGCKGIGPKKASELLTQFGSIDAIYEHLDELSPSLKKKLEEGRENTLLSRYLAKICTEVPMEVEWETFRHLDPNVPQLQALLAEFEMHTLAKRLLPSEGDTADWGGGLFSSSSTSQDEGKEPSEANSLFSPEQTASLQGLTTLKDTAHTYHVVRTREEQKQLWARLAESKQFAFDTETDGLNPLTASIVAASFAPEEGEAYYLPLPQDFDEACAILQPLDALMRNTEILKMAQNAKFDQKLLARYGVSSATPLFDTLVAHYLIAPDQRHNLDTLAEQYLGYRTIAYSDLSEKKNFDLRRDVAEELLVDYAAEDADVVRRLYPLLREKLEQEQQEKLFWEVEMPLVGVLERMEREGVQLDVQRLHEVSEKLTNDLRETEDAIFHWAGHSFNVSSPKQVGVVLFEELGLHAKGKKTKTNTYSTSEEVLSKCVGQHPIVQKVLDYRGLKKLIGTYTEALPELVYPDGRLRTSYNQAVTVTGRLSSSDPNLQNIPIRSAMGQEIRSAFVPRSSEFTFLSADYSQIELRLMAHFSQDEHLIKAFVEGEDVHRSTAARIYNVAPEEVTPLQRSHAKTANFGIIYGISAYGLSQRLNIDPSEASALISSYFENYPAVRAYMDECVQKARKLGYTETLLGRRRYLPDINSRSATVRQFAERNAVNAPIQGTAADLIKVAMIRIDAKMRERNMKSRMIMQVHDELNFDAYLPEVDELRALVHQEMCQAIPNLRVPLEVEIGVGSSWLEAH